MTEYNPQFFATAKQFTRKLLAELLLVGLVMLAVGWTSVQANTVLILDGEQEQIVSTVKDDPLEILEEFGYELDTEDRVYSSYIGDNTQGTIRIVRAFPATVQNDSQQAAVRTAEDEMLPELTWASVTLSELGMGLSQQEEHVIEQQVEIPFETETIPTSLLAPGDQRVLVEGCPGLCVETYTQLVVNGSAQQPVLQEKTVLQEPVMQQVLVGEHAHPISDLDFGYAFDANGEPIGYKSVLRSQPAAGYSAPAGSGTASGQPAVVGHVAVDPNVIPYGSKLYIKSTDGSFVYGYAIAADTGIAIQQGLISVDLFYGTYMESALNGIKQVDIFILE